MTRSDFNGDGRSDILWRNEDGRLTEWLGTGAGAFTSNANNALYSVSTEWQVAGTGDFNGDGRADVLWRSLDGRLTNWLGSTNGQLADNVANALSTVSIDWHVAGVGDFNGDGRSDVLWRNADGRITDWLGNSVGGFSDNVAHAYNGVSTDWQVAGLGDFNGDGRDDILWRNDDGRITNWLGTNAGGFSDNVANAYNGVSLDWQIAGVGDFNGDQRDDILWRNEDGRLTDWLATQDGGYASNASNALFDVSTTWQVASIGDYDGDGRDDILWRNSDGRLVDWLGTASGGFGSNAARSSTNISNDWQAQPAPAAKAPDVSNPNAILGGPGNDQLVGTTAGDTINGGEGNDTLSGLGGNDLLSGDSGQDVVYAGAGDDVIYSWDGDTVYGGTGADTFQFDAFASTRIIGYVESTSATIMDFQTGVDTIDIRLVAHAPNDLALYWLGSSAFTGTDRFEVRFDNHQLQIDFDGDFRPDLIIDITGNVTASDITYIFDPWGY